MSDNRPGLLIVFEGTDGTGKSTQLKLLATVLVERGFSVVSTFEPSNGIYGTQIRELFTNRKKISPEEELDLFLADRKDHVDKLIAPSLKGGKIILCDRYYLSTIAYQGAAGLDPDHILARNDFAPVPDLALLFHAPLATGIQRITEGRGDTLNDFEKEDYLQKVATQFEQLQLPCIKRIDAERDIEAIHQDVLALVNPLLRSL
ncbi:MAG TPA: dTMP kinase [Desulfocapsa sulfexigens]|nr:dTMP kinase [Desulfocapsa sulfexigens]HIQ37042.1 dTMP kinase [Desulfocapsa sulfexigens]